MLSMENTNLFVPSTCCCETHDSRDLISGFSPAPNMFISSYMLLYKTDQKQASKQEETGNSMSGMKNSEGIFARRYSIIKSRMNTLKTFPSKMVTLNILFLLIQLFFFPGHAEILSLLQNF